MTSENEPIWALFQGFEPYLEAMIWIRIEVMRIHNTADPESLSRMPYPDFYRSSTRKKQQKIRIFFYFFYYVLGKVKNIIVLSTMEFIAGRTDDDQREKPALFKFYDFTMGN